MAGLQILSRQHILACRQVVIGEQEIPEGRQSLSDSHANLEKVAAYCIENFARAENKAGALEETKNYTTQSLASVAYQINTLAYNFLQMVEQQANQLAEMESQVNYISQMVMVHKEKVARREIGVLTTNKTTARQYKILAPANTEKPIKYVRKPIDFTTLDDVGHGIRSSSSSTPRSRRSTSSVGMPPPPAHQQPPTSAGPAPTTKPPTPPQSNRSVSSLSRGSREYRTPPAVAPPQAVPETRTSDIRTPTITNGKPIYSSRKPVPSNYAPNYPIGHPRRNDRSSGYSTLPHQSAAHVTPINGGSPAPPPQVGMVHPMSHGVPQGSYTPPPPPPHMQEPPQYASHPMGMPRYPTLIRPAMTLPKNLTNKNLTSKTNEVILAPPSPASSGVVSEQEYNSRSSGASSPPLPPPPTSDSEMPPAVPPHFMEKGGYFLVDDTPAPHRTPGTNANAPAVPPHYLEKVIAVYDYSADKEDELTFSENAVIYVLKKNDDGWWEGVMNGVTGLFPGNYVEPLM
ncbi:abl interactor 2-like [Homarus americanus]|uniref:abl interactor 2-like n=1 Tax=Homarus americanus TaxID=6706 RepID=UPI001C438EAB|nr:abl interactor 2-like [Homarus americanus]